MEEGRESDLEYVRRLVNENTGIWIPVEDIGACHPLREENTFILAVHNSLAETSMERDQ